MFLGGLPRSAWLSNNIRGGDAKVGIQLKKSFSVLYYLLYILIFFYCFAFLIYDFFQIIMTGIIFSYLQVLLISGTFGKTQHCAVCTPSPPIWSQWGVGVEGRPRGKVFRLRR